ncbi:hypothetical protein ACQKWADRAFT_143055 [Trichoderma austrokoningii]
MMLMGLFITQVWRYLFLSSFALFSALPLAIYYSISLSLSHLCQLIFPVKKATICARTGFDQKVPATPPQQTVQSTGTCTVSLPLPPRQASSSATTLQTIPPARTPQLPNRKVSLPAAPTDRPHRHASLGYSLKQSPTPPQIAASQGPGPLPSATPSGALPAHSSTHEPVSLNANTPLDAHMLQAINFPASASRLPGSPPPPTFASKHRHLAANFDLATLQMPSAISFRREGV